MSQIHVEHLTFAYPGSYDPVFEDVSFTLDTDWRLGFTGRNGRGKTTFLRLLCGEFPYEGTISASVRFEYFPYSCDAGDSVPVSEALHALDPTLEDWRLLREFARLNVSEDVLERPFSTLSNGEQTKVLLAALFLRENAFLLIDEPTNHLDEKGRELLAAYLRTKKGFLLVSHDRALLDACTDHTLSINRQDIDVQQGNFSSWYENKQREDAFEAAENDRLKKDIRRLRESARQTKQWADKTEASKIGYDPKKEERNISSRSYIGKKSEKMQQRRKNLERRQQEEIEEKSELLRNVEETESLKLSPLVWRSARLCEGKDVSISYGDRPVTEHLTFSVFQGERIALCGENGCGKSSVLKLIIGEPISCTGKFSRAAGLKISYVAQNASALSGDLDDYARGYGVDIPLFRAILRKLDFSRVQFEKPMESYSAGQKKKVMLARSLCEQAHLYIWDEPLNYIDVFSRMQIEALLLESRPTLLFVEHDRAFTEKIATRRIELGRG